MILMILLNDYIKKQEEYCRSQDLLTDADKQILNKICERKHNRDQGEFFNLITDELSAFRYINETSYLYTYRQAQALSYCCEKLNKKIDINVTVDSSGAFVENNQLYDVDLEYITITYLGKDDNNENNKKTIKSCV